ncbi:putative short-chain dehydrogenase/reductase family protein [Hypoxylon sp. NC1633]|nr:putative short-chain dehydrogenase/reductase family protein [Hypoxylon sp. NC1633]
MSSELKSQASFEGSVLGLIYRQLTKPKPLPTGTRLTDQVAIVTGSNVGVGLEASRQLLQLGLSHLVMGVRSQARGDKAADQLRKEFPSATISVWIADLESYESIQAFVERCATLPRIDIAILNAALQMSAFTTNPTTGFETTMQVDYLSTALLAILLLPVLKAKKFPGAATPPVLSIVGSDIMYFMKMEANGPVLRQFDNPKAYSQMAWYGKAKLVLMLFVIKLAAIVSPDDVILNVSNPGMTKGTQIFRDVPSLLQAVMVPIQVLLARTPKVAASNYVDAVVTYGKTSHGSFISDWAIKPHPKFWYTSEGKAVTDRLWEETIEELNFAKASSIVEGLRKGP